MSSIGFVNNLDHYLEGADVAESVERLDFKVRQRLKTDEDFRMGFHDARPLIVEKYGSNVADPTRSGLSLAYYSASDAQDLIDEARTEQRRLEAMNR